MQYPRTPYVPDPQEIESGTRDRTERFGPNGKATPVPYQTLKPEFVEKHPGFKPAITGLLVVNFRIVDSNPQLAKQIHSGVKAIRDKLPGEYQDCIAGVPEEGLHASLAFVAAEDLAGRYAKYMPQKYEDWRDWAINYHGNPTKQWQGVMSALRREHRPIIQGIREIARSSRPLELHYEGGQFTPNALSTRLLLGLGQVNDLTARLLEVDGVNMSTDPYASPNAKGDTGKWGMAAQITSGIVTKPFPKEAAYEIAAPENLQLIGPGNLVVRDISLDLHMFWEHPEIPEVAGPMVLAGRVAEFGLGTARDIEIARDLPYLTMSVAEQHH